MSDDKDGLYEVKGSDDGGPDGVIVIHYPKDGHDPYGIGPFPPVASLVDAIILNGPCDCRKEALPIAFPSGISIMLDPTMMAEGIAKAIFKGVESGVGTVVILPAELADQLMGKKPEPDPKAKDRLN